MTQPALLDVPSRHPASVDSMATRVPFGFEMGVPEIDTIVDRARRLETAELRMLDGRTTLEHPENWK